MSGALPILIRNILHRGRSIILVWYNMYLEMDSVCADLKVIIEILTIRGILANLAAIRVIDRFI